MNSLIHSQHSDLEKKHFEERKKRKKMKNVLSGGHFISLKIFHYELFLE